MKGRGILIVVFLISLLGAGGYDSTNYASDAIITSSGGGSSSSGSYEGILAISQTAIGKTASTLFNMFLGFFHAGTSSVQNAPNITSVRIEPVPSLTNATLSCYATAVDAENTSLDIEWTWYNQTSGSTVFSSGTTSVTNNTEALITTLAPGQTSSEDVWNCSVRAYDGTSYSEYRSAATIIQGVLNLTGPADATIIDRDSVHATQDAVQMTVKSLEQKQDTNITFYANLTDPAIAGQQNIVLGTALTDAQGDANLSWDGRDDTGTKVYAGNYTWWATADNHTTINARVIYVYGGQDLTFRYANKHPNATYENGAIVNLHAILESFGPETRTQMNGTYEAQVTARLTDPQGGLTDLELIDPGPHEPPGRSIAVYNASRQEDDITDSIKEKDGAWAYIHKDEAIEVTFEEPLMHANDITLYAQSPNTSNVKVFASGKQVAAFTISKAQYYKQFLSALEDEQETFIFIGDNAWMIDLIIDPAVTYYLKTGDAFDTSSPTGSLLTKTCSLGGGGGNCEFMWVASSTYSADTFITTDQMTARIYWNGDTTKNTDAYVASYDVLDCGTSAACASPSVICTSGSSDLCYNGATSCYTDITCTPSSSHTMHSGDYLGYNVTLFSKQSTVTLRYNAATHPSYFTITEVLDTAPNITTPSISPSSPNTSDSLDCIATPDDGQSSTVDVEWEWFRDGASFSSGTNTGLTAGVSATITTLDSADTAKNELWNCTVRSYDGSTYSAYDSAEVTIQNTAPQVTAPVIHPPTIRYEDNATANTTYTDSDADTGSITFTWYVNGVSAGTDTFNSVSNGTILNSTLSNTNYNVNDRINVSVQASDGTDPSSVVWSSTRRIYAGSVSYSSYDGDTTDFENIADTENVDYPVLERTSYGKIIWKGTNLNVSDADFDSHVNIADNLIDVDIAQLNGDLDSPANISLYNLDFLFEPLLYRDGQLCGADCTFIDYSSNDLTFNVSGFSSYTAGSNSQLTIWDDDDSHLPYTKGYRLEDQQVNFFANYTNTTGGEAVSGTCQIAFGSGWNTMDFNVTKQIYEYNRTFSLNNTYEYNVSCDGSGNGFEPLNTTDTTFIEVNEKFWNNTFNTSGKTGGVWNISITSITPWFFNASVQDRNFTLSSLNSAPAVTLKSPTNGNETIITRTPFFIWNASDEDGDALNFTIWIDTDKDFSDAPSNQTNKQNFSMARQLNVDTVYYWKVQATDRQEYTNSSVWNFTVMSYIDISFTTQGIAFGSLNLNTSYDTQNDANPFVIQNNGNIVINISKLYANQSLWIEEPLGSSFFQFRADNDTTEPGSFDWSLSQTVWKNISAEDQDNATVIAYLNYNNSNDDAEIDLNITVPEEEPPGFKQASIYVTGEAS